MIFIIWRENSTLRERNCRRRFFETLQRRGTSYDKDSFKRIAALAEDEDIQKWWKYFLKNVKDITLELSIVIEEMQTFLEPVFDAIVGEQE